MMKTFFAAALVVTLGLAAAQAASTEAQPAMVPAAAPGVYAQKAVAADRFHLTVTGHSFTGRDAIEKYLAWRAADLTLARGDRWFRFIEARHKGDTAPVLKRDVGGPRYSFRMENFRPIWRYKLKGDAAWKSWSPFRDAPFFADGKDAAAITDFEVSADIQLHKDQVDDADPLAFEAGAVSDLLINQVSPPQ